MFKLTFGPLQRLYMVIRRALFYQESLTHTVSNYWSGTLLRLQAAPSAVRLCPRKRANERDCGLNKD